MKFLLLQHLYDGSLLLQHEAFSYVFLPFQSIFDLHPEFFKDQCGLTQLLNVHLIQFIARMTILSWYFCINYFSTRYQSDDTIQGSKPFMLPCSISTDPLLAIVSLLKLSPRVCCLISSAALRINSLATSE